MTTVTLEQLTTSTVDGTGVFDKLMEAVEAHIDQEFKKNRIKGPEYATVYLGALQSTLDQSIRFLLTKDDALLKAKQIEMLEKQMLEIDARIALTEQQTANAIIEGTVLTAQECKLRAEYDLIMEQKLKTVAEAALLAQKKVTEQAQTDGTNIDAASVVGKQIQLYDAQRDGYRRDAEQKVAKLLVDSWNVRMTTNDLTEANAVNKLSDTYIGQAVGKLLDGVNAAP